VAISSEDVEVTSRVEIGRVAITSGGVGRDTSKGIGVLFSRGASVGSTKLKSGLSASSHRLVVGVEALVSVLDQERLLHGDTRRRCEPIFLSLTFNDRFLLVQLLLLGRASVLELHERST